MQEDSKLWLGFNVPYLTRCLSITQNGSKIHHGSMIDVTQPIVVHDKPSQKGHELGTPSKVHDLPFMQTILDPEVHKLWFTWFMTVHSPSLAYIWWPVQTEWGQETFWGVARPLSPFTCMCTYVHGSPSDPKGSALIV